MLEKLLQLKETGKMYRNKHYQRKSTQTKGLGSAVCGTTSLNFSLQWENYTAWVLLSRKGNNFAWGVFWQAFLNSSFHQSPNRAPDKCSVFSSSKLGFIHCSARLVLYSWRLKWMCVTLTAFRAYILVTNYNPNG